MALTVQHMARQERVKRKMQIALRGTPLTTELIQPHELKWIKPGKEIWLNNSFFDVLSIDSSGIPWKVFGLYDPEDTKLHMKLIRLLHKEEDQEGRSLNAVTAFWSISFLLPSMGYEVFNPETVQSITPSKYTASISTGIRTTPVPPPWTTT